MATEMVFTAEQMKRLIAQADTDSQQYLFRFVEKAVLQSPEIQRLREDAGRYRGWRKSATEEDEKFLKAAQDYETKHFAGKAPTLEQFDAGIDAAMEKKP